MDIAKLTNVKYSEKFNEHRIANVPIAAPNMLNSVVWELATRNPQWTFYVAAGNSHGERSERKCLMYALTMRLLADYTMCFIEGSIA